ncbi:WbqC family protein [Trueperella abortisuis]|uniref:WbqC family protein n=1 Tax=Trueperella abortisuis TaxID=445930 RepID=UPI002892CCA2|nr:WbqC family protein [Trueperella abortisuis]
MNSFVAQQPRYLPWVGFFERALIADYVVIQDDLQFVRQEYQSRTRVADRNSLGWRWLTVPIHAKFGQAINAVFPVDNGWYFHHRNILHYNYSTEVGWRAVSDLIEIVIEHRFESLAELNVALIRHIFDMLDISATLVLESELNLPKFSTPDSRLISLAETLNCSNYISGQGGRNYHREEEWSDSIAHWVWHEPELRRYDRGGSPWISGLSIVDMLAYASNPAGLLRSRG